MHSQAALAFVCDLCLATLPSAGGLLPPVATALSVWPGLLPGGARDPLAGTLQALLYDLCQPPRGDPGPADGDSVTAASWGSGSTAEGGTLQARGLARVAQQEVRRLGLLHWGWQAAECQGVPELRMPRQCGALLAQVEETARPSCPAGDLAMGSLSCALAVATIHQGWHWARDEVRTDLCSCCKRASYCAASIV